MFKILLAGDSTVTDHERSDPYVPGEQYCAWGELLHEFFKPGLVVENYAKSGLTTESFRNEGFYAKLMKSQKPGDFVFIQFGHNDQKRPELRAEEGYRKALTRYINEVRGENSYPVLVTSPARNTWRGDNGEYSDLLKDYAQEVRRLAAEMDVPLLDLNKRTTSWIKALGLQSAKKYFVHGDYTHANVHGAYVWTRFVALEILKNSHPDLKPLQSDLLPLPQFPALPVKESELVNGWQGAPARQSDFERYRHDKPLTYGEALAMAQEGYNFFVSKAVSLQGYDSAFAAAKENGYLPKTGFDDNLDLTSDIPPALFEKLMRTACESRNAVVPDAESLGLSAGRNEYISGNDAVAFALELEKNAAGCLDRTKQAKTPAGS